MNTKRVNTRVVGDLPEYLSQKPLGYVWQTLLICSLLPLAVAVALTKPFYLVLRNIYLTVVNVIFPNPYRRVQLDRIYSNWFKFRAKGLWIDGVGFCYLETLPFNLRGSDENHLLYINNKLSQMCVCQYDKDVLFVDNHYCTCKNKITPKGISYEQAKNR